ncbi:MAG TPA: glycosyltransferase family 39 protein [Vicinamibacteria bacterium]|nr:glycosyltransferase family 39 protein [Vicinamibacteria bacterium]
MPFFRDKAEPVLLVLLLASLPLVTPRIAESDAVEYFSYLPSLVLDFDLDFEDEYRTFYEEDPEGRAGFKETFLDRSTATGLKLNFGPIGTAVLWSPFYLATHLFVRSADGMSQPYRTAVSVASALYAAVGLFLCYRLARRYASSFASFVAVVALWWATPVAYYMYIAPGMSHAASLFAVAVFFSLWPWATSGGPARWAVWGASAGLMALVREQDLFFAVAALLAVLVIPDRLKKLAAFGAAAFVVFLPQLVVYQVLNGTPEPAPEVQRKMIKYSPHFFEVLFSSEHGLFFWSPILLLFFAGGLLLLKKQRYSGLVLLAAFVAQVYISGAVDSWTQAGAFGARRFVGATAIFAVWGAFLLEALEPRFRRAGVAAVVSIFILWNASLMIQFGLGLMDRDKLVWSQIVHNHLHEVPPRLGSVLSRYVFSRGELEGSP